MCSDLYVEAQGSGPRLVFLHGWGLNLRVWDGLRSALASEFRIVAVDLPGHGRSPWHEEASTLAGQAKLVVASLARSGELDRPGGTVPSDGPGGQLGMRHAVLLGWSLGGQVALEIAATVPEPFDRLVLIATTPKFAATEDWPHGMPPAVLRGFAERLATDYRRTVSDFLELQVRGSSDSDAVLRQLRAALFEHGEARPEALSAGLRVLASTDLRPVLGGIRQPTLAIAGQYDRVTPPQATAALASSLPRARFLEIRRAAHAPFLSHAEAVLGALREFLSPA